MSITIKAEGKIDCFLTALGFKKNGEDYYNSFAVTDLENDWEEEIYVSKTNDGYEVYYPEGRKKDRIFKGQNSTIKYILKEHGLHFGIL